MSQFYAQPKESHWKAAKRILRYVQGTLSMGLVYEKDGGNILNGFCDYDWVGDKDTQRSTSGYCFYIGGVAISCSKQQKTIALSSAEAEYKAAPATVGEALWLRRILEDGGKPQSEPTLIQCDNQSCIALAKSPVFHARSKHIEIQYHFVREKILDGEIVL